MWHVEQNNTMQSTQQQQKQKQSHQKKTRTNWKKEPNRKKLEDAINKYLQRCANNEDITMKDFAIKNQIHPSVFQSRIREMNKKEEEQEFNKYINDKLGGG